MKDITFIPYFNFSTVAQRYVDEGLLQHLIHDGITEREVIERLMESQSLICIDIDGYFVGFWSMEQVPDVQGKSLIEIHVYMLPEFRRYSIDVLKYIKKTIFENSQFTAILTTVPDDYSRVIPVLEKRLGFQEIHHQDAMMQRNGVDVGLTYLILTKE